MSRRVPRWRFITLAVIVVALGSLGSAANAAPTFDPRLIFAVGGHAESMAAGEFNLDGDPDFVVADRQEADTNRKVVTLLGGIGAAFSAATQISLKPLLWR